MLAIDSLGNQFGFGKDDIRPALACLGELQDFRRELGAIHDLEIHLTGLLGEKLLVDPGAVHPGGVEPDGDPGLRGF
jgi:hypothetical protein